MTQAGCGLVVATDAIAARIYPFIWGPQHAFRILLASLAQLREYLHLGSGHRGFPAGGRQRLLDLWRNWPPGARIEVTQFFTVALRPLSDTPGSKRSEVMRGSRISGYPSLTASFLRGRPPRRSPVHDRTSC